MVFIDGTSVHIVILIIPLWALYDMGILRLFEQLNDSRDMLVSRNDNLSKLNVLLGIF